MTLHPSLAARLPIIAEIPQLITEVRDPASLEQWMAFAEPFGDYAPPAVRRERAVAVGSGADVPVVLYRAVDAAATARALVWVHGGGYAGGSVDMFEADGVAAEIAARTGALVVSVDYRLAAPGVHHPLPMDDVVTAFTWASAHAAQWGVDRAQILLGGASAGAALAATAALRLRDAAELPAALVLAYPIVHAELPPLTEELERALDEVPRCLDFRPLRQVEQNFMLGRYLGRPASAAPADAVAGIADVTGLPPTLIVNAEYDALRASGEAFAARLALAGVDVSVHKEPGVLHGYLNTEPTIDPVRRTLERISHFVMTEGGTT